MHAADARRDAEAAVRGPCPPRPTRSDARRWRRVSACAPCPAARPPPAGRI